MEGKQVEAILKAVGMATELLSLIERHRFLELLSPNIKLQSGETAARLRGVEAQRILDCSAPTLLKLVKEEVFTVDYPDGPGPGKRCWYWRDEVELYRDTRSKEAVRAFRKKNKRVK